MCKLIFELMNVLDVPDSALQLCLVLLHKFAQFFILLVHGLLFYLNLVDLGVLEVLLDFEYLILQVFVFLFGLPDNFLEIVDNSVFFLSFIPVTSALVALRKWLLLPLLILCSSVLPARSFSRCSSATLVLRRMFS